MTTKRSNEPGALATTGDKGQEMMSLALQNGADPEVLNRLMDLQERWDNKQARGEYVKAMSEFKKDVPSVLKKDAQVDFTSQKGRTHYKHATLGGIVNQITASLSKHGLSASWETEQDTGSVTVTCHITHEGGHRESVTLCGPPDDSGNKNKIQQIGSSVTYLQRYTLLAALGLATADQDDGDDKGKGRAPAMPVVDSGHTPDKPEPSVIPPSGGETITGLVEAVSTKTGKNTRGPWTKYGIKVNGEFHTTFSDTQGAIAKAAKDDGQEVEVYYTTNDKGYRDIVSIEPVIVREPGADEDELPL